MCFPTSLNVSINRASVERVASFRYMGTHITEDLTCSATLHFLRVLRRNHLEEKLLVSFYWSTIERVLMYCATVWFTACSAADRRALQRITRAAERITSSPLPPVEDIASYRCLSRAQRISRDTFHPGHGLFNLMPSGKQLRSLKCKNNRLRNSFYPWAVRTLNSIK